MNFEEIRKMQRMQYDKLVSIGVVGEYDDSKRSLNHRMKFVSNAYLEWNKHRPPKRTWKMKTDRVGVFGRVWYQRCNPKDGPRYVNLRIDARLLNPGSGRTQLIEWFLERVSADGGISVSWDDSNAKHIVMCENLHTVVSAMSNGFNAWHESLPPIVKTNWKNWNSSLDCGRLFCEFKDE